MTQINLNVSELELARKIFWLLANDFVFLHQYNEDTLKHDDGIYPAINCNDIFVPGSDSEGLSLEDIDKYIVVVKEFGDAGAYAWVAAKRNSNPWRWTHKYYTESQVEFVRDLLKN